MIKPHRRQALYLAFLLHRLSGLGLALCQRIASQLGGELLAHYTGARFELRLVLPFASASPARG